MKTRTMLGPFEAFHGDGGAQRSRSDRLIELCLLHANACLQVVPVAEGISPKDSEGSNACPVNMAVLRRSEKNWDLGFYQAFVVFFVLKWNVRENFTRVYHASVVSFSV